MKKWLIVLGSIVLLSAVVIAVIAHFLSPIAVRLVKARLVDTFGPGRADVGSVSLSVLTRTVVIGDLAIRQAPGFDGGNFVAAKKIAVGIELKPLLQRRLVIREIVLSSPEIAIVQSADGRMNTAYFIALTRKRPAAKKPAMNLFLREFAVRDGRITFTSHRMGARRPTFVLSDVAMETSNLSLPNKHDEKSPLKISAILDAEHPARMALFGNGILFAGPLTFQTEFSFEGFALADYRDLFPSSSFVVKDGVGTVRSKIACEKNMLTSEHHVEIERFAIGTKEGTGFGATLAGLPARIFVKFVQDGEGKLRFDFTVNGNMENLKVDMKGAIGRAVSKSLGEKMSSADGTTVPSVTNEGVKEDGRR